MRLGIALLALSTLPALAEDLPAGPGKEVVEKLCTSCHGPELITGQASTRAAWQGSLDAMVNRGATGTPEEFKTVLEYLFRNFGRVNVNTGTVQDIETVLNITTKEAETIVQYRKDHGNIKDWDALLKVEGLDAKKLQAHRNQIAF